jgi:hypothetical protein
MAKFARFFLDTQIAAVAGLRRQIDALVTAAEAVALKLIDGGEIYIASVRPDFTSEGFIRSGGLMMLKEYRTGRVLTASDVVLVGWTDTEAVQTEPLVDRLKAMGACVVGMGTPIGALAEKVDFFLDSRVDLKESAARPFGFESYPFVSLQNLVVLWAFTGELVSALTRKGRMPAMFQSVLVPGARQRNAGIGSSRFHAAHTVPPLPCTTLANSYLEAIEACLCRIREGELDAIGAVARACGDGLRAGRQIHAFLISHFPVHQAGAPGDPRVMHPLAVIKGETPDESELIGKLRPGDLFFFLGYYRRPARAYEIARARNCQIIEVITGTDAEVLDGPEPDFVIHPGWHYTDSLVPVPGYDVRILPASGILQAAVYWAVVGEIGAGS